MQICCVVHGMVCFHCHAIKNKNANHSIMKVQNLGNEEDQYANSLAKSQACAIFHKRDKAVFT